jgi:hypothetical protein
MCLIAFLVLATLACGKKGPLLPPYVRQPAAAEVTNVRRAGNEVYVTITVPKADIDGASPASVASIEVWAVTTRTPPPAGVLPRGATLVMTIPVAREGEPGDRSGKVVPDPTTGALQGTSVTILDTLTPEELVESVPQVPVAGRPLSSEVTKSGLDPVVDPTPLPPQRYYFTLPRSDRTRPGLLSAIKAVPLSHIPDKVTGVRTAMSGHDVVLEWEPSGGILGWLLERPLAPEVPLATTTVPPSTPVAASPPAATRAAASIPAAATASTPPTSGPTRYNVYRELAPDPVALTKPGDAPLPWTVPLVSPINPQPLSDLTFVDEEVPFDERLRCYHVRAVRGTGTQQVESEPSNRACIVPIDLEPPVMPTGLSATVHDGEVELRWEPNGEEDLRGYVVLRREAGDDTLVILTRNGPIAETRYTDGTVIAGRMYTYSVQAVDNRIPLPNVSEPAEAATVTAR